jgi:hydroxymethylbilane synthase
MARTSNAKSHQAAPLARLRIGTRGSALALWQANAVRDLIAASRPEIELELEVIKPEGDLDKESSLLAIGGRGVFASGLQEALLDGSVDLAVHSTKDVPTLSPTGLAIAAFPQREDAHDAVVSRHGVGLAELPANPLIGTSSRRRAVQVKAIRPDSRVVELRGNIDTRLRKAESEDYDAVIVAAAGLIRMGWESKITEYLNFDVFVPSPGQGALAIEARVAPDPAWEVARALDVPEIATAVGLERAFLVAMAGGCTTPIGAHAEVVGDIVRFWAMIGSDDGDRLVHTFEELPLDTAADVVPDLAHRMVADLAPGWSVDADPETSLANQPLAGHTALLTGTGELISALTPAFVAEGAPVLEVVTLEIGPSSAPDRLADALERAAAGDFDWLVLTSRQAVPAVRDFGADRLAGSIKVAAVGGSTADALREAGLAVVVVPEVQTGVGLVDALAPYDLSTARVLCLLGSNARDTVPDALTDAGAQVERVEAYTATPVNEIPDVVRRAIQAGSVEIVTFASPSSAKTLAEQLGVDLAALSGACLVAIGPTTAGAMSELGLPVHVVADEPSPEGILAACRAYFAERFKAPAAAEGTDTTP